MRCDRARPVRAVRARAHAPRARPKLLLPASAVSCAGCFGASKIASNHDYYSCATYASSQAGAVHRTCTAQQHGTCYAQHAPTTTGPITSYLLRPAQLADRVRNGSNEPEPHACMFSHALPCERMNLFQLEPVEFPKTGNVCPLI